MYQYAKSTNCFYDTSLNYNQLPDDIIYVSAEDFQKAIQAREENRPFDFIKGVLKIYDACPGAYYDFDWKKKKWVLNTEKQKQAKTIENQNTIKQLFALANEKITPLQDAVDCDIATEEEKASLITWKKYRALLNRIDPESETIELPEQPQ